MPHTTRAAALVGAALLAAAPAAASPELARGKNCIACHHAERRVIGPPWRAIAERYDASAVPLLSERVIQGHGGVWGPTPMPAQPQVSQEEAETLVRWILSQR